MSVSLHTHAHTHICCDMPASSMPNSHTYPSSTCAPPAPAPHLTPPCPPLQAQSRGEEPFPPPACGGQSLWICQPNSGPSSLGNVAQQAHSTPQPQWMGVFEMSPQTPDSGDVPLSGSSRGALMTDSIFVSAIAPRRRRWICKSRKYNRKHTKLCQKVSCCQKSSLLFLESGLKTFCERLYLL